MREGDDDADHGRPLPSRGREGQKGSGPVVLLTMKTGTTGPTSTWNWTRRSTPPTTFFGGDLRGIEEKLPYIESLGVTVLYLNPIFRSPSNHKYDTGNYLQVDPSFGTEEDLRSLCAAAKKRGIRVILDGVFSHTGADSFYFNKYGTYGEQTGAYRDEKSPYRAWYRFRQWPKDYDCWVGLYDAAQRQRNGQELPRLHQRRGRRGRALDQGRYLWLAAGRGRRIADALFARTAPPREEHRRRVDAAGRGLGRPRPTRSLTARRAATCAGDTLGQRDELSLREAVLAFFTFRIDAYTLVRRIEAMRESMPASFFYSLMNLLGSHDKPRAINVLADCGKHAARTALPLPAGTDEGTVRARQAPPDRRLDADLRPAGHALHLLRRRSRADRHGRPLLPQDLPLGPRGRGIDGKRCASNR